MNDGVSACGVDVTEAGASQCVAPANVNDEVSACGAVTEVGASQCAESVYSHQSHEAEVFEADAAATDHGNLQSHVDHVDGQFFRAEVADEPTSGVRANREVLDEAANDGSVTFARKLDCMPEGSFAKRILKLSDKNTTSLDKVLKASGFPQEPSRLHDHMTTEREKQYERMCMKRSASNDISSLPSSCQKSPKFNDGQTGNLQDGIENSGGISSLDGSMGNGLFTYGGSSSSGGYVLETSSGSSQLQRDKGVRNLGKGGKTFVKRQSEQASHLESQSGSSLGWRHLGHGWAVEQDQFDIIDEITVSPKKPKRFKKR